MVDSLSWPPEVVQDITQKVGAVRVGTRGGLRMKEADAHHYQPDVLVEEEMRAAMHSEFTLASVTPQFGNTPTLLSAASSPVGGMVSRAQTPRSIAAEATFLQPALPALETLTLQDSDSFESADGSGRQQVPLGQTW